MSESWDPNKPERRLSRNSTDQIEIEIHAEKIRLWLDGASTFLANESNQRTLIDMMVKALDQWADIRRRAILEKFGMYAVVAVVMSFLSYLGWRGWNGK